jgi:hypothetical protein
VSCCSNATQLPVHSAEADGAWLPALGVSVRSTNQRRRPRKFAVRRRSSTVQSSRPREGLLKAAPGQIERTPRQPSNVLKGNILQIYMFKSENDEIRAFAGDVSGSKLPSQFAPWQADGTVNAGTTPPHRFSRFKIESAIKLNGYQLWRLKPQAA